MVLRGRVLRGRILFGGQNFNTRVLDEIKLNVLLLIRRKLRKMAQPLKLSDRICRALNVTYGTNVVVDAQKFIGKEGTTVTMHVVKDARGRGVFGHSKELFRSGSAIYTCLYMRDLLYSFQGRELPTDDEGWERMKEYRKTDESIAWMLNKYVSK